MRMQLRQHLAEIFVEKVDSQLDILDIAMKQRNEKLLMDEVCKAYEG